MGTDGYLVKEGDCVTSIAKTSGHFWETIWQDPGNAELREARKDPNVLLPEDRVTIPAIMPKQEPGETEMRHRFVRRGEPAQFSIKVLVNDEPRANEPYTLKVDGRTFSGFTGPDGGLRVPIPGDAKEARLWVGPEGEETEYPLGLGDMDPVTEVIGVQRRLNNLGFECGKEDNILGPATRSALERFQSEQKLPETGEIDEATQDKLREKHGS
jgi:hypothetical protein